MKHILFDMCIYKYAFFYNWEGFELDISGLNKYGYVLILTLKGRTFQNYIKDGGGGPKKSLYQNHIFGS